MSFSVVKLTSKGQLTLPKEIREKLGLEKGSELSVQLKDEQIIIKKAEPAASLDENDPIWDMVGIFYSVKNGSELGKGALPWKKWFS